ncbi:MAG TPA: DUF87 domain-containing protein [Alphaproteobacteria bacterium]
MRAQARPLDDARLEALLAGHVAILGRTGSGKSYVAKGWVERLLRLGRRVCVIDPTGVWWGLKSSADGKAPGFPVAVLGGDHADIALAETAGELLGRTVAERAFSCVVDLSDFLIGERHRFMTDFLGALYRFNKRPLHLVCDEADEIAAQSPLPEHRRLLHATDRIVRRGRVKGFRVVLITQRPAVLHKNVLTQAAALVAMRVMAPQDRKAIEDWIKGQGDVAQGREVLDSLARLKVGEGWLWAPDLGLLERRRFPAIETFDSGRAPGNEGAAEPETLAQADLAELQDLIAATSRGDAEACPGQRAGGAEQKQSPRLRVDKTALAAARAQGYADGRGEAHAAAVARLDEIARLLDAVAAAAGEVGRRIAAMRAEPVPSDRAGLEIASPPQKPVAATDPGSGTSQAKERHRPARGANGGDGALYSATAKLLGALARVAPARLTWTQAATLAGMKARGGHFNAGRKEMRDLALVESHGDGLISIAAAGLALAGFEAPDPPRTTAERVAMWKAALPALSGDILDLLVNNYPGWVPKRAVADRLGKVMRGGHWNDGMARLRNNELIESHGEAIRAAPHLFTLGGTP